MKIAYYEENSFHTEIIGTFIFNHRKDEICIFNNDDLSQTLDTYAKIENFKIIDKNLFDVCANTFDRIYISYSHTTDEMYSKLENKNKVYVICHLKSEIKPEFKNVIVLTPINHTPGKTYYILPIHGFDMDKKDKMRLAKLDCDISVIGRFKDNNRDYKDLMKLIKEHEDKDFRLDIYSRHVKFVPKELQELSKSHISTLRILTKLNTAAINKRISDSKFILTNVSKDSCYYKDRLTGMIPLAFNLNIPLIIDYRLKAIYNIRSCIEYKDSVTEVINDIVKMEVPKYYRMVEEFKKEKNMILQYNHEQFARFL